MNRVMILTASTGGGHNQAARTLENKYRYYGHEVKIIDFIKVSGKVVEKLVLEGYSILYSSLPAVYKGLYKYSNNKEVNTKISSYALKIFEKKIYKIIMEEGPDLIIGTHAFIVNVICNLKKKRYLTIPFISVITDFKAHRLYVNKLVDAYIAASEYTRLDMISKGVNEEKIYPYGIPIKQDFFNKDRNERLSDNRDFTILLMGGSIGSKSIEQVLRELLNCRNKLRVIVVCGRNQILMENIKSNYQDMISNKEMVLYGFTNNIPELMEEADLLISKPGGLTVSEAIASNLPMLIPFMIPGQEEENADFLVKSGAAKIIDDVESFKIEIDSLIEKPYILRIMKSNMSKLSECYSLDNIIKLSDELINEYCGVSYS